MRNTKKTNPFVHCLTNRSEQSMIRILSCVRWERNKKTASSDELMARGREKERKNDEEYLSGKTEDDEQKDKQIRSNN